MMSTPRRPSINVVGVRFSPAGLVRYFDPGDENLAVGDRVLVESDDGPREAVVAIAPAQVLYSDLRGELAPVLRKVGGNVEE
jgi:cell fate regulator YaaT (PSP1 superfamily)